MKIALTTTPTLYLDDYTYFSWKKKRNKVICSGTVSIPMGGDLRGVTTVEHFSVCKHGDEFEFIFGMRKSMENLFRKYPNLFNRDLRTKAYQRFDAAYGLGVCEPRESQHPFASLQELEQFFKEASCSFVCKQPTK